MALTMKKKHSYVFNPPNYNKSSLESKVEKLINDTIKEKLFNLLDVNRIVYFKLIEYFVVFTINPDDEEKILSSVMMRIKNKQFKFREIKAKEIQLSGINMTEFYTYLENSGAKEILNVSNLLENL
jgi:hypothetical protein